ncbi:MAG: DUF3987 domain-containing protein [Xanthomonadaceae bacterium]|nr:DUF3987 domain-containing protein [Xanthomonadaceae bacterium]
METEQQATRRLFRRMLADGYRVTAGYLYCTVDGAPWCRRIRFDHPSEGKEYRPLHWSGTRYVASEPPAPAAGKPLYYLPELLAADPAALVWIVEGEKCVENLTKLNIVATTSGGCTSASGADWTPLRGRHCIVWPDHDAPGTKYADEVAAKLRALGCKVEMIDVEPLGLPDKGDAVDWLAMHPDATTANVLALARLTAPAAPSTFTSAPEPLPEPLPAVPAFDADMLPASVRAWCVDAADGLQVPLDFTAIPAIVALAGTIGRRVGIAMKQHARWYERPMLWGCVIGRPSSGKSPALSPARRMLERLAREERAVYAVAAREHEARVMVADAAKANAKKAIQAALKKKDQTGAEAAAETALFEDEPPSEPRIVVNDATVEKLGELLNANPRGLVQFRDELAGWLANLDREGRESDRAFWLECWNGTGAFTVDRIGRGTVPIEACAMSILGGMQPGKLAEYVRGAIRGGFSDDGLIQRFQLAVYPDLPANWTYTDRPIDPQAEATAWATFQRLRALDADAIGAECHASADVPFLRFDNEAQGLLIEWQTQLMGRLREGNEAAWMESHLAKYPALAGRLALVLHLADGNAGPVSADTLATALDWCGYLEGHARRIYAPAMDNGLTAAHLILKKRPDLSEPFTARDLQRRGWAGLSDRDAIEEGLEVLVECRHLLATATDPGPQGGRRSVVYEWRATP